MIYSRSSQYAIRALRFLSNQQTGRLYPLEKIARAERIPQHFLGKIMQRLVRKRLIQSVKGINGGFSMRTPPEKITLYMIVDAIDDISLSLEECVFGHEVCSDQTKCPLHEAWKEIKQAQVKFLQEITIAGIAATGATAMEP
jgi:Rrf2 family protein